MRKMNKKGFTLVELMVVLAILGLLAAVGIPQYTKVMERARIGRDVAAIATVQTKVTAFITETQWRPSTDVHPLVLTEKKKSALTGGDVKLSDFFEDSETLPSLESDDFKTAPTWHINMNGVVYVKSSTDDTKTLPGQ